MIFTFNHNINKPTMTSALTVAAALLAATSLAPLASAFITNPSSTSSALIIKPASKTTALHQELPFFAAPAFSTSSSSSTPPNTSSSSQSSPPQSATVTLRLPLGTLFDGRDYIFVTESNVRGYEWTGTQVDILLDDLMVSE